MNAKEARVKTLLRQFRGSMGYEVSPNLPVIFGPRIEFWVQIRQVVPFIPDQSVRWGIGMSLPHGDRD